MTDKETVISKNLTDEQQQIVNALMEDKKRKFRKLTKNVKDLSFTVNVENLLNLAVKNYKFNILDLLTEKEYVLKIFAVNIAPLEAQ